MFFLTPRFLKEARHVRHAAIKLLRYKSDVWSPEQSARFQEAIDSLTVSIRTGSPGQVANATVELEKLAGHFAPPLPHAGWRENCEVFLVAIIIAAGVRAYFLQPFKIPTGSMQPTLYGIVGTPTDGPTPNIAVRAWDLVVAGRAWVDLVAPEDVQILELRERTFANFFTFTDILAASAGGKAQTFTLFAPMDALKQYFRVVPTRVYRKGQPIARGSIDTGDQVFVDKVSYNFVPPKRGDVFVFKTTGIRRIEETLNPAMGSQYYIKRLAGLAGDELRIAAPNLFINGEKASEWVFQRVMSCQDGYRGYSNNPGFLYLSTPEARFRVPAASYFALGDNSYNSSDSRFWGAVPQANLTGRGLFVYWPFTKRWGLIR